MALAALLAALLAAAWLLPHAAAQYCTNATSYYNAGALLLPYCLARPAMSAFLLAPHFLTGLASPGFGIRGRFTMAPWYCTTACLLVCGSFPFICCNTACTP